MLSAAVAVLAVTHTSPALPNARQLDFMELEISQFMHFGVDTAWEPNDAFLEEANPVRSHNARSRLFSRERALARLPDVEEARASIRETHPIRVSPFSSAYAPLNTYHRMHADLSQLQPSIHGNIARLPNRRDLPVLECVHF